MEKSNKERSAIVLSKSLGEGTQKTIFRLTASETVKTSLCFIFQFSKIFSALSPFGIAFYASVFKSDSWIMYFLSSLFGMIVSKGAMFWTYAVCMVSQTLVFALVDGLFSKKYFFRPLVSSMIFFSFGFVRFIAGGYIIYDLMSLVLESLILGIFCMVFINSADAFDSLKKRSYFSDGEKFCILASVAVFITAFGNFEIFENYRISSVLSIVIIMLLSLTSDESLAVIASVMLATIGYLSGSTGYLSVAIYPMGAVFCIIFKKYTKSGAIMGFSVACLISLFLPADSKEITKGIYDLLIASAIFVFIPQKVAESVSKYIMCDFSGESQYLSSQGAESAMLKVASSLGDLSELYKSNIREKQISREYVNMIKECARKNICRACPKKAQCCGKNGDIAFQTIDKMFDVFSAAGKISPDKLPEKFKNQCIRIESFCTEVNHCIDIVNLEKRWIDKTNETRKLVAKQIGGVSDILKKEYENASRPRSTELEGKIRKELDKTGIRAKGVCVKKDDSSCFNMSVMLSNSERGKDTVKKLKTLVENAVGISVSFGGIKTCKSYYVYSFYPQSSYSANFGYASRARSGETVCGDSFDVIYTGRNKMVMVLSDGMGSGENAKNESRNAVRLLDKFLGAGFDCETGVSLINSTLLMNGTKECFATMDICDINLASGEICFIKLASSDSIIKYDGKIKRIKGDGLPVGILREAHAHRHMLPVVSDTVIVMMSDGVADIALKNPSLEGWIEKELMNTNISNAQLIASRILNKAAQLRENNICDDMTVLAGCISKITCDV